MFDVAAANPIVWTELRDKKPTLNFDFGVNSRTISVCRDGMECVMITCILSDDLWPCESSMYI